MKKKIYLSRRQMLTLSCFSGVSAAFASPIQMLVNGLVEGIFAKAQAAKERELPRNFVYLGLYGAPPRWHFDLPLFPYSAPSGKVHPFVGTRFKANSGPQAGAPEYVTVPITRNGVTLNMPYLWSCDLPTSDGKTTPMADLISNMLIVRGINMGFDGHRPNFVRLLQPNPAAPSLNGFVADGAQTPVPAVVYEDMYLPQTPFKSKSGVGRVEVVNTSANPLARALGVFNQSREFQNSEFMNRRDAMEAVVNAALKSLSDYANSNSPGAGALNDYRSKAEALLKSGVGDLAGSYQRLFTKYKTLIQRCGDFAAMPIEGLTNKPIPPDVFPGMDPNACNQFRNNVAARNPDMRTLVHPDTVPNTMAAGFAVVEYLLLGGYSSTVAVKMSEGINAKLENAVVITEGTSLGDMMDGWSFDEHPTGSLVSMVLNAFVFRSLAACLNELIAKLKDAKMFSETVIQVGSEFSRSPNDNCNGSNHGWNAGVTSLFSGALKAPMVLGNTNDSAVLEATHLPSAWGAAGNVLVDGAKRNLAVGHASNTVAHLLRVERPMKNDSSLVTETSKGVEPNIELAKSSE